MSIQFSTNSSKTTSGPVFPGRPFHTPLKSGLKRCHIDHETVTYIPFEGPFVCRIDILDIDHLHIGNDIVFGTMIQHLLRLTYPTDHRTADPPAFGYDTKGVEFQRLRRQSH